MYISDINGVLIVGASLITHNTFITAVVDCGALGDPANGQVEYTATTFGSVAEYTCGSGCDPVGDSTRTCTVEGTWSGSTPQCPGNEICVVQHI